MVAGGSKPAPPPAPGVEVPHPFPERFEPTAFERRLRQLPERRPFEIPRETVPARFRRSSVLILFWREAAELHVLLTKRGDTLRGHPGQMCFPGGRLEPDEDWVAAALRESHEEVGLAPSGVEVLGRLDDAWSGAGHLLVPVVGWHAGRPALTRNPAEVAAIHTPRVSGLLDPAAFAYEARELAGSLYVDPILRWEGGEVIGLSSDLLIEALAWGLGQRASRGPDRARALVSYLSLGDDARPRAHARTPAVTARGDEGPGVDGGNES
ncbi:MAG TPA: CoA pyrophosphatase [Myxococcota bacterium]|nr:CoA pyrophosphatase [Myxococcota bacterium]